MKVFGDRFCLMVKKGYRDPPYHNWMHAFSVSHFCYLLYKNLGLSNYLEYVHTSTYIPTGTEVAKRVVVSDYNAPSVLFLGK